MLRLFANFCILHGRLSHLWILASLGKLASIAVDAEGLCCSWLTGDITVVPLEYSFSFWAYHCGLCMWISSFLFWPSICSLGQFSLRGTNLSRPNFTLTAFSSSLYRKHPGLWCVTLIPAWPGSLLLALLGPDSPSDYNWPWTLATSPWALERVDNVLVSWSRGCTPHNHLKIRDAELPGWRSISNCPMPSILFPAYLQLLGLT